MFKENNKHRQKQLFSFDYFLPEKKRKKLKESKEYAFYQLILCKIDEKIFSVLYSDKKSRPNAPINVMLSSLILKEKNGWSYKQLLDRIDFDIQIRTALGLQGLEETPFTEPTIFDFQNRLNDYNIKHGVNLIEQVFDRLTNKQLEDLNVRADIQRSDSFLVASNIRKYSRLQLLIEGILRFYRVLKDEEKKRINSLISSYLDKKTSGRYIYDLSRDDIPKEFENIGRIYLEIIERFRNNYQDVDIYKILERLFEEHFTVVEEKVSIKSTDELSSSIMQSPDDLDATYRKKRDQESRGQLVNITETANAGNDINLICDICNAPNNKDDSKILNGRIDKIKEKTPELTELHTDGAYGSEENDKKMEELEINHIQTGVRGRKSEVVMGIEKKSDCEYEVSCPNQKVKSSPTRKRYKALFDNEICVNCKLRDSCPTILLKKNNKRVYYFSEVDYLKNRRHRYILKIPEERRKLRPNVEATVKEFKDRLNHKGKLKVRGAFKTSVWAYTIGIAINFGRIYRYTNRHSLDFSSILSFFKEQLSNVTRIINKVRLSLKVHHNFWTNLKLNLNSQKMVS